MPNRLHPPPSSAGVGAGAVVGGGNYTNDLPAPTTAGVSDGHGPGVRTPKAKEHRPQMDSKRKQTLLSLLEALSELQKDGLDDSTLTGSISHTKLEKELEEPTDTADEQLQKVGAEAFNKFQKRINNLDRELRNFANASRQLGSSVGILSSAFRLRERLAQVLFLFRENAADLFPRKVHRQSVEAFIDQKNRTQESSAGKRKRLKRLKLPHAVRPVMQEKPDVEDFPEQLEEFAKDVITFLNSLNEFPEFTDEAVNSSINAFETDLKYWASCLKTYEGQFKYPSVQRYLHDLTSEMADHLDTITSSLSMFLEIGIPTIRFAQKHAAQNLLNLTTVATFFSAVTATTLQFSVTDTGQPISDAVNSFWFCSLVFSIASAVNSLLGLTWKQAIYRSPGHRVPWWVLMWIKRTPLIFLVISVAAFSVGLCLFAYSSHQSPVTAALTTVFTTFSSFGLLAVSAWFTFERWTFNRHRGKKWLMDILKELRAEMKRVPIIRWISHMPAKHVRSVGAGAGRHLNRIGTGLTLVGARMSSVLLPRTKTRDTEDGQPNGNGQPATSEGEKAAPAAPNSPIAMSPSTERVASPISTSPLTALPSSTSAASLSITHSDGATSADSHTTLSGKRRLQSVVSNIIRYNRSMNSPITTGGLVSPRRQRTVSSSAFGTDHVVKDEQAVSNARVSRVASLIPALKALQPMQFMQPHSALVRHLQFSPNGEFLATCSWDRTCCIFKVKDFSSPHRILAHPQGFVGQVAWSPKGDLLLTKMVRGMKIWTTESGVCRKTIDRQKSVQSVAWFPQGEAFLSVEGSNVTKLDLNGKVIDTYEFDRMILHDVAITEDQHRMLCVATLTASPDGFKPSMSREEKQIIVYNLVDKEIENQVPILHDVRDITLARNGNVALVSYENKAPPQLWKLELLRDRTNTDSGDTSARLSLVHTYMPKTTVDFAGTSYFGGKDDQLVLCAAKAGDIHIWDRTSAFLLHTVPPQDVDGDLTCIAWNHAASPFMFATGTHDGTVRIWTTPPNLPSRNSYVDLRQSGANTPRTTTPPPGPPSFTLDLAERTESPTTELESDSHTITTNARSSSPDTREAASRRGGTLFANVAKSALAASKESS